jgi:membrane-bound serine protease (ClpP class)
MRRLWFAFLVFAVHAPGAGVLRVNTGNIVHPVSVEIVSRAIEQAQRDGAELVLLRLNTPGGMMEATREIVEQMVASPVPVAVWVGPSGARAASAGFFLLLAADVAAMAPGTRTGAASPVLLGQQMDPVMRRKVESDASAWIRSLAARRGRNAEVAEKAVLEAKSFTEQEALAAKLIDVVAANEEELLRKLDGREITLFNGARRKLSVAAAPIRDYQPSMRHKIIRAIADPNIAFILVMIGLLGLYMEFNMPGAILPGVLGALLLLFGLSALSVLPINWLGAALLILSIGLFAAEAFVTSHGILGIGGGVALVFGALLLVDGPPGVRIGLATALGVGIPCAGIAVFLATLVVRTHREKVSTGDSGLLGQTAVARTPLNPAGKVFVHGEYWDATSPVPVPEGAHVRVTAVEGLRLRVEPLP